MKLKVRHAVGLLTTLGIFVACSSAQKGGETDAGTLVDASLPGVDAADVPDTSKPLVDAAKDTGGGDATTDASVDGGIDAASDSAVDAADATVDAAPAPFTLSTSAFAQGATIPAAHACNTHASPALTWTAGPANTLSYAVVMIDKTRVGTNDEVHWVLFDVPSSTLSLAQGVARSANPGAPAGSKQVLSFDGLPGYFGPCPPMGDGAHTYEFRVYAMPVANLGNVTTSTGKQTAAANVASGALAMTNIVSGTYAR